MGRGARHDDQGREGFVYVIEAVGRDLVKIGYSTNPLRRLWHLQNTNPDKLRLLLTIAGPPEMEAQWHLRFLASRERGEWFRFTDDRKPVFARLHAPFIPEDERTDRERELYELWRCAELNRLDRCDVQQAAGQRA